MRVKQIRKKLSITLLAVVTLAMMLPVCASAEERIPQLGVYTGYWFEDTDTTTSIVTVASKTYDGNRITYSIPSSCNSNGFPKEVTYTYEWVYQDDDYDTVVDTIEDAVFTFKSVVTPITYTFYNSDGNKLSNAPADAGSYTLTATGEAKYCVTAPNSSQELKAYVKYTYTTSFAISKADGREVTITQEGWTYGEDAKEPVISCSSNDADPTIDYYYGEESGWQETVPTNAGTYKVRVTYPKTNNYYNATVATADFTISKARGTASIKQDDWTYGEEAKQPVANSSNNGNTPLIQYNTEDGYVLSWTRTVPTNAGTYQVMALFAATENYESIAKITKFTIKPKQLTVTVNAEDKEFDGTTTATVNPQISGVIDGDTVKLQTSKMKATFSSATVGENKKVTVKGLSIDNDNYTLPSSITGKADIKPKSVSIIDLEVADKSYDGTTDAEIKGMPSLSGLVDNYDDVQLVNGTPSFVDKAVGSGIGINFTEFTLSGDDSGNYTVVQPTGITANITECLHASAKDDGDCLTSVVCPICGKTVTAAKSDHAWGNWASNGDGTHTRKCTTDGCNETETKDCTGGAATCKGKQCTECGAFYGDLADHSRATKYTADGTGHWYTCTTPGCTEKLDFAKHTPDHEGGATEEYPIKCTECKYVMEAQLEHTHKYTRQNTDALYKATDATCTKAATYYYSCTCGATGTETFEYGDCLGHSEGAEWLTDEDYHWRICMAEGCGAAIESSKGEHADTVVKDHKCDTCGKVLSTCADNDNDHLCDMCGAKLSDHSGGEANCTSGEICSICKNEYGAKNPQNHTDLKHFAGNEATATREGNIEYWYCDGCKKYFSDESGTKLITLKDIVIEKLAPEIIEEEEKSVTEGEKKELTFTFETELGDAVRAELDGKTLDAENYTTNPDGTVTLKSDYVATLPTGEHTLIVVSEGGIATAKFTVNEKAEESGLKDNGAKESGTKEDSQKGDIDDDAFIPQTGDESNAPLWPALLLVGSGVVTATTLVGKKKSRAE